MVSLEYLLKFIDEDAPSGDLTSDAIIPNVVCRAIIRAEQDGIAAGLEEAGTLFSHFGVEVREDTRDGTIVKEGEVLLSLSGPAKKILLVERTALNIIGRMSGIATQTRAMAELVRTENPRCRVAGTRKTSPGLRLLDKKAITLGGGDPHRTGLSDGVLIKDNHLVLVSVSDAIERAKAGSAYRKIEIEVESAQGALAAARSGADILLLDNMSPEEVRKTIAEIKAAGLRDRITIELSGGITAETIREYARTGADLISLGALTHTVRNFSVTLEILSE
ncbi:carboxylating nicotinate-nucleotide diphosphorylase [Methanoregula sp.]|uniref:carboxylating nicotinate-nucleotide diphosphorylase n=1 Tax=Methanoregula sp. TaxID=2052170 RepID=UPI002C72D32C|nr:carboxylating nicotinate-nucleotide diphosphorylase [Methanoregula sp.]HVP97553.1 carboxylating nicotinate-nucleotide diphosphorylase [Methanoregula sp.]